MTSTRFQEEHVSTCNPGLENTKHGASSLSECEPTSNVIVTTKMPRTLRKRSESSNDKVPQAVPSDSELSEPDEMPGTPPSASFKGRLTKYQYTKTHTITEDDAAASTSRQRPAKRTRATMTATTKRVSTPSPRPKKKRKASKYADPSKYAHLSPLVDILEPNLICVFVGTNPGVQTAAAGHAYAHPSNLFWKLLHSSGLTDRRLKPEEDRSLPAVYCMGNTNIVERPSKDAAELSKEETAAGTAKLDAKFLEYKPEAVCIVGKGIWEAIWRYRYGKNMSKQDFKYGWQDEKHNMGMAKDDEAELDASGNVWKGSKVFVTTSTSGLAASLKPAEKEAIWKPFGEWVQKRRIERGFVPQPVEDEQVEDAKQ
jgi:mismatch-specific thymine-DNA glycosylase